MISVVTSCSLRGWEDYGQRFVKTFRQYWPQDVQLYVVSEDLLPWDCAISSGFYYLPLKDSAEAWNFLIRHRHDRWASGDPSAGIPDFVNGKWPIKSGYCYLHDAYKFCKKVFAIELAAHTVIKGRMFWFDCDVVTFAPVSEKILQELLPDDTAISCLERPGLYTETGFVGYNLDHSETRQLIVRCADMFASDKVFQLEQWHDCWVFDLVRRQMNIPTFSIPHKSHKHPFINSMLGQYFDHLKGPNRKRLGRTPPNEQFAHRNLDYWRV